MPNTFDGPALGALAAGTVFAWAGIKGYSIGQTIQYIIKGKTPANQTQVNPVGTPVTTSPDGAVGGLGGYAPGVQPSAMPSPGVYTHAQCAALWVQMGGAQATSNNAACHAIQESSGHPMATSSNPDGGTNVGLYQLDTKGVGAGYTVEELQNAANNTRITIFATRNGTDWSEWATPGC